MTFEVLANGLRIKMSPTEAETVRKFANAVKLSGTQGYAEELTALVERISEDGVLELTSDD